MFSSPLSGLTPFQRRRRVAAASALVQPAAWWDYTQGVYSDAGATTPAANGDPVSVWTDRIAGYQATQGIATAKPTLAANGLSFDGGDRFALSGGALSLLQDVPGATIICVAQSAFVGRIISFSINANATNSRLTFGGTSGNALLAVQRPDGTAGTSVNGAWSPSTSAFQAVSAIANFATREGYTRYNKTTVGSTTTLVTASGNTSPLPSAAAQIGATANGGTVLSASIMTDLMVFKQALSIEQHNAQIDALAALRGFTT